MANLVFVSYAWPRKADDTAISARNKFMHDLRNELGRRIALNDDEFCFYDFKDIEAGEHDYNQRLRASMENCAVGLILRDPHYMDPAKPYCLWEYQQLSNRSEVASRIPNGPKVLLVVNWNAPNPKKIPLEWRREQQHLNQSILDDDAHVDVVEAVLRVTRDGLLDILTNALMDQPKAKQAYTMFLQVLAKYILKQRDLVEHARIAGHLQFPAVQPYDPAKTWTLSNAGAPPTEGSSAGRKKIIYTIVAAHPTQITEVSPELAWRYKDDGFEDWRPFAVKQEDDERVSDLLMKIADHNKIVLDVLPQAYSDHLIHDLKKYDGKYPIIIFIDPWTIHKIDSFRVDLEQLVNSTERHMAPAAAIVLLNETDSDLIREQFAISSSLKRVFEGTRLLPKPASNKANCAMHFLSAVDELRLEIRKHSTPSIERAGTKRPMVNASEPANS